MSGDRRVGRLERLYHKCNELIVPGVDPGEEKVLAFKRGFEDLAVHVDGLEAREGRRVMHDVLLGMYITSMIESERVEACVAQLAKVIFGLATAAEDGDE